MIGRLFPCPPPHRPPGDRPAAPMCAHHDQDHPGTSKPTRRTRLITVDADAPRVVEVRAPRHAQFFTVARAGKRTRHRPPAASGHSRSALMDAQSSSLTHIAHHVQLSNAAARRPTLFAPVVARAMPRATWRTALSMHMVISRPRPPSGRARPNPSRIQRCRYGDCPAREPARLRNAGAVAAIATPAAPSSRDYRDHIGRND